MYDHIGLKVKDLESSVRFYSAALAGLGFVLCSRDDASAGFGPKGEPALWLYPAKGADGRGVHVAFSARDRISSFVKSVSRGSRTSRSNNGRSAIMSHGGRE